MRQKKILVLLFFIAFGLSVKAQLSDLHYLPPLKQGRNNAAVQRQAVYLSTPEPTTFLVNAYRGTNPTPVATFNISNNSPAVYNLPNGDNNITLVDNNNTGVVLTNSGLRFESPSGNRFYVNYRGNSAAQATSLTSKGRVAMGTRFKWGGVPNLGAEISKSNTLGIMATEDNTTVTLSGYDPNCVFRLGNNVAGITDDTYTITLNANESFVFENYVGNSPTWASRQGWIGASIVSNRNIVISNGSMNFGRQENNGNRDAGIDQPVPENRLGKDYVFVRGNGHSNGWTEFPLIIATADNTQIFVNGSATPIATLNNGDYFEVPSSFYSSSTAGANMFVQTSKDAYAYQCLAGSTGAQTAGLNFVAPVNCLLPDVMDNIPDIRNIAGTIMTGGVTIIAAVNTPDANIQVTDGTGLRALPPHVPVPGTSDWKTFYIPNLTGNVSVQSTGPMAVGFFGVNGNQGVAGYFSGFDTVPEVTLEIRGGTGCFVGSEIYEATGNFDAYQWYFEGEPIPGANRPDFAPTVAGDYFVRGTKGPCTYDSQSILALYCDPDIVVNKTVDHPEILEGETATFTIRVRNLGVGPVTNLQITDNLPAGLTLESAFTISGSWSGNTWNIGTLNGGETAILELQVRADEIDVLPLITAINTVSHTQDQIDANITEDQLTARLTIHNDNDNDGVRDIWDLDDDNDGIYDDDECSQTICFQPIINESFETPVIPTRTWRLINQNTMPGWSTTATDGNIEIWSHNFLGVPAFDGNQFAELNATQNSALYQNLCLTPGTVMQWSLRHRGRAGTDVMRVRIGSNLSTATVQATMSDDNTAWVYYSGTYTVPANQNNTVFIFEAVSTATGNLSVGNLIDDIQIGIISAPTCSDTDNDGLPDNLDLDSDGDGCSDANEFYKDNNADGGDDGVFGVGTPSVNPDGTVIGATYVRVIAPEIILGNTTENLGGTDINGQDVSLGQSVEYVLRFQNTGDDNARNFTIRNVLPNNVNMDNIDLSNANGTTFSHDLANNTITFSVPDNMVEIGDPEYSIRIRVTIAGNCSEFVAACASQLENRAFVTYQGTLSTDSFSDEPGSAPISGCASAPEVANNSIFNDLAGCNEARTVQLCGDFVILSAGQGFLHYTWFLDANGNGIVDAGETALNDNDPDNDPRTFVVTTVGDYIVQKTTDGTCPDMMERITVERFGTTQTNPIVDYFSQVNSDNNPDNDIQGEVVTCSIDGDVLQKIFLCGADDEATIQLGITDAQSIVWQQLDESSCSSTGDDCANKNGTCTWNTLATQNNFTVTDSGEYRVVINYQNGCFSRFYFNVFKNALALDYLASDILCSTPGNIRITNVGSGYGFQLVDVDTDNIVVPFSANNGPNFNINTSGTYKVQVTQLNPIDGMPILGSCLFETDDIGIQERVFTTNVSATPAACGDLGSINVQALNALPNYSYQLRLDDGSNGGLGSLVSDQPALNENTLTFPNVNPGNYIVTTSTQDGCFDSRNIVVEATPDLLLSAVISQNISCNSGIISVTPSGGSNNSNYQMAIWSKDGVALFSDPSSITANDLQSAPDFLFPDGTDAGTYEFIVFDDTGCHAISNTVTLVDLGDLVVTASNSTITCSDSSTASLSISVTGGTAPYRYSLDGGSNYQADNTFYNLAAGIYDITVMDSNNSSGVGCIGTLSYEITQPFRLTASPSILEDASCDPNGALVKILNPNGGQAPYQFSFDGGSSFSAVDTQRLLPGTYQLAVNDALGCTYPMEITVPDPVTDPTFAQHVDYDCLGAGTITITPSNTTDFTFEYELNGNPNAPLENNVFTHVAAGTQTVTVTYATAIAPNQSTLFLETFGAGPNTQIGEIGPGYCYEPQDGRATTCNLGPAGILVDGEYAVTSFAANPNPAYRSPNDHTGLANGRFLAIHPSNNLVGSNSVIWSRSGIEVLPNRDMDISLWAYNLRQTGSAGNNPEIQVELLDAGGNVINSMVLPEIPKNTNADDWHNRTVTFNPGANAVVDIVLRSSQPGDDGNELILDDIQATQQPEICEKTTDITVVVEAGQAFEASLLGTIDPSCNGGSDGAIRFEVSNFDAATGFEYSTDGGATWTTSLVSPVTTTANLPSGAHTVTVRKVVDTSCTTSINTNLNDPSPIVPQLVQVADYTCFNTGGTLEASAMGGNPAYEYQLEDTSGNIIAGYQTNDRFANITDGDYVVRVRDQNGCEVVSTTPVTIAPPSTITFDLVATACYDGQNNATVTANVTAGNGAYQFRINGGAWNAPTPSTATSYTFSGLSNGSYDIEVTDAFGCVSAVQNINISPTLLAQVDVVDVSACADGSITVTPSGGVAPYSYAYLPTGTMVQDSDFGTNNSFTITSGTIGTYDVYLRDNNAASPFCQLLETVTVQSAPILSYTATPTDALCFGDRGSINVTISPGLAPFTYELVDVDHGTASTIQTGVMATTRTFFNLLPGDYNVIVTDDMGCSISVNAITIVEPAELTADIIGVLPSSCSSVDPLDYGFRFENYPTTLGTIEFSADGGTTWTGDNSNPGVSDVLTGHLSGTNVFPSMRTVDGLGNTVCQVDLPRYTIPYPLDDLDITISTIVVNCNELQVSVQGSEGVPSYEYAYSDDPANFLVASATWIPGENFNMLGNPVTPGHGMYQWTGLVPGRTYVFYVRDSNGCVRQSNVNVNDITTNPMVITATYEPSCNGANDGEITYDIVDTDGFTEPNMTWTLFDINGNTVDSSGGPIPYNSSIAVTGLAPEEYYIVVQQVDGGGVPQCISASENLLLEELDPITATLNVLNHITCEGPGRISVTGIQGGGGNYTYTVTGPAPFTAITGSPNNPIEIPANSPSGNYDVEISDQYGCSYPLGTVTMTLTPNPSITNVDVANCSAATSVTITATTGASSMLYSLDGGATYVNNGGVFNNVVPGIYTVFVKDGNGCTDSTAITVHPSLQATASLTESLGCGPGQEAELTLSVSAGSGNYEYQVTNTLGTVVARQGLATNPLTTLAATADTYTVTIYDIGTGGPECSRVFTITVPPAILPNFTADAVDVSCPGASDGSIALTQVNNGNNPLTYTLSPNNGTFNAATSTFEHLPADTYTVTATGPNGCTTVLNTVIVDEPNPITFTLPSVDAFGCTTGNAMDNAIISIDVASISGGSGTYTRYQFVDHATAAIMQNGTNPNLIFTDIAGGDVMVRVYDENGCMGEMLVSVAPYDALGTPTVHVDDAISCTNLGEDIALDITSAVTSFATDPGNYEFRQLPAGAFQASNQFMDLQPGNYTFVVRNRATGCERVVNHSVADPNTFGITVNKMADVVCFGDDGSITLTLTDVTYTGSFSWAVYNTNGTPADRSDDGTAVATGNLASVGTTPNIALPAGNYIVEVFQDAFPDCGQVRSFNINTPAAPVTLDTIALEDVGCSNDQGSAAIRPLGGVAPYAIQLTNTTTGSVQNRNGVNAHLFTNLTAGVYTVEVTDALGCTQTFTHVFELLLPDAISGTLTATDLVCEGDTNASLSLALDPRNVTSNYRYRLRTYNDMAGTTLLGNSASQTSGNFNNLGAGFYRITVEDDMGCTFESAIVEIVAPVEVSAQLLTEQTLGCQVGATLVLRAQGGTAPYSWSTDGITFNAMNENNGPGTHVLQNMVAGTYQYFVQDSFNCVSSLSNEITINAIEALSLELNASAAFINCNGESTAVINATADGGLGNYQYALFADAGLVTEIRPYQPTGLFDALPQGTYYVHVRSGDCTVLSQVVEITEPEVLTITPTITDVQCFGDENGSIVIEAQGGTGVYQYAISPNLNQFDDDNTFDELAPGDYSVIVQDSNGCFEFIEFTINQPELLEMELTSTPEVCAGDQDGTVSVTITGGTAPYHTALDSNADADFVQDRLLFDNLAGGTYLVFVRDANGCTINQTITVEGGANLNATAEVVYECTGDTPNNSLQLLLEDAAVAGDVLYALDSTDPNDFGLDANFTNMAQGSHYVAIAHANGCINTIAFEVEAFEPLQLVLEQRNLNEITAVATGGSEGYTFYFGDRDNGDDNTLFITRTDTYTVRVVDANGCEAMGSIFMEFIDIEIPNFFTPDGDGLNDTWKPRNIEQFPNIFIKIFDRYGREIYILTNDDEGWNGLYQEADLPTGDYWYIIKLNGEEDQREFIGHFTMYR